MLCSLNLFFSSRYYSYSVYEETENQEDKVTCSSSPSSLSGGTQMNQDLMSKSIYDVHLLFSADLCVVDSILYDLR